MIRRKWAFLLGITPLLLLGFSGCVRGPTEKETQPPEALRDHGWVSYDGPNGGYVNWTLQPGKVPDWYGRAGSGWWLDETQSNPFYTGYHASAYVTGYPDRHGLGPCMTPYWGIVKPGDHPYMMFTGGTPDNQLWTGVPPFLVLPKGALPSIQRAPGFREDHKGWAQFLAPPMTLASAQFSDQVVAVWGDAEHGYAEWRYSLDREGPFPTWFAGSSGARWTLRDWGNEGTPIPTCQAFTTPPKPIAPTLEVTPRATREDPPVALSLSETIRFAESTPTLKVLPTFLKSHPDAYILDWTSNAPRPTMLLGEGPVPYWNFTYTSPNGREYVLVHCEGTQSVPRVGSRPLSCDERDRKDPDDFGTAPAPDWKIARLIDYAEWWNAHGNITEANTCTRGAAVWDIWVMAGEGSTTVGGQAGCKGSEIHVRGSDGWIVAVRDDAPGILATRLD